jgi:hypothetical protein
LALLLQRRDLCRILSLPAAINNGHMSDEEARRYEWRVLEAIDPERARRTRHDWQYQDFDCYAEPPWVETTVIDVITVTGGK